MSVRALTLLTIVTVVVTVPASSSAHTHKTQPVPATQQVVSTKPKVNSPRTVASERASQAELNVLRDRIATLRNSTWKCQDELGVKRTQAGLSLWALGPSVSYRQWIAKQWTRREAQCKKALSARQIPAIGDWITAVNYVQRIYPGTDEWLRYISDREGGWGVWVWYGGRTWSGYHIGNDFLGADTVGGWMQFRYSTFAPYWRGAQQDLLRRGYILPDIKMPPAGGDPKYAAWLSPIGQALTAGYMRYTHRDGCHWCL